ncbi:heterokaryon incompatibility protein-domain-containing protein [Pyrenochaeta sp. MPI-SDFR-AT-0127]|nr:heterokaryon incompatibility protein-domain-containing protein [Pyrenochaeta sp. MPI-SDFR-AT-0127]
MADDKVPIRAPVAVRPSFMYSPLNDSLDEFRLMSVLPYQPDTRIQIELCHASMSHASLPGSYRCLSYTWGPPDDTQEISLGGHPFRVRRNLYEFLEQAAKSLCDEKIWVDVLCINQDDDDEKAKQIVKMGLIFHRAKEVLVWLGNDNDLFLFFEWMNSGQGKFGNHAPGRMESTKRAFLQHPYWNRAWITQEILVATSIRVLYSTYSIEWTLFQKLAFLGAQTPHLFFCEWRNVHMDVNQEEPSVCHIVTVPRNYSGEQVNTFRHGPVLVVWRS